jgi:hypothetical protein
MYSSQRSIIVKATLILAGVFFAFWPGWASALSIEVLKNTEIRNDFVLGPGKTELLMNPGDVTSKELTVTNRTGRDIEFRIEIEDFTGSRNPEQTTVLLGNERGPYSLKDYLKVERTEFVLSHGERARIPVEVRIPHDAEPGGRYGTVLLSAQPPKTSSSDNSNVAKGGAKIITRLGTLFFVRISGEVNEAGQLRAFRTLGKRLFASGPIRFEVLYENNGNVHLNPYGIVEVTNILGNKVGEIKVDPWFAMPNSLRFREVRWDKSFLFGRYRAHAQFNRGYQDIVDEADAIFWVIPWRVMLFGFVILFVILLFLKWVASKFELRRKL